MIPRPEAIEKIRNSFRINPVTALLGPRQCGKTTVARMLAGTERAVFFDLESPIDLRRLSAPMTALEPLTGLVIIDEIQRRPDLFPLLRVLADRPENKARFLLLGSASASLARGVSESLAGRLGFVDLSGFSLWEAGLEHRDRLWVRGGFPRAFLQENEADSMAWRAGFIRTFLERDIPQFGITIPSETIGRFWSMVAHYHGQVWNAAQFARSLGSSESTARRYLDILAGSYMVRVLPPWFENMRKRQVKAPKVYVRDSGVLHALLGLGNLESVQGHPKLGASWEGFAVEQVVAVIGSRNVYFWATHAGAELDLLAMAGGKRYGFEFKYADAPGRSRSMNVAVDDLGLEHLWVVYPGKEEYGLDKRISAIPLQNLQNLPVPPG